MVMFAAFIGSANAFEMVLSEDRITVHTGETKTIDLAVVSSADDVIIFATPIEQPWMSMPTHIFVNASQQAAAKLTFAPFDRTESKTYTFLLALQSLKSGERRERNVTVIVNSAEVAIERMSVSGTLEPNGFGQLDIYVKNYQQTPADVVLAADAAGFLQFTENITLAPGEFKLVQRGFTIPECQPSGEYNVHADVRSKAVNVFSSDQTFVIPEKFIQVTTKNETTTGFKTDTLVTIKNAGNVNGVAEYSDHILGALFFSGDKPAKTDDGFMWVLSVDACQTRTIRYQIDYTPIPVGLFVVFAVWYIFFRLRTVRVTKRILQRATIEKGLEFTVGIDVKSWINAKDVEIRDFVPSLFEVRDTPGIKPIRRKTDAGTELLWRFKNFMPHEERILDYKIVPLFSISGEVNLPRATVSFEYLGRRVNRQTPTTALGLKFTEHVEHAGDFFSWIGELVSKAFKKKA
jgi:hypothetical protein